MLIFHGDRTTLPGQRGPQLFTTLRRLGIDARFGEYPDEAPIFGRKRGPLHREVFACEEYVAGGDDPAGARLPISPWPQAASLCVERSTSERFGPGKTHEDLNDASFRS